MPVTEDDVKKLLCDCLLESYREEYDDLIEIWKSIEAKAQATAAMDGIFLAAVFALVKDLKQPITHAFILTLAVATVFLIASVIAALIALVVRKTPALPVGARLDPMVQDLLRLDNQDIQCRLANFTCDRIAQWRKGNEGVQNVTEKKAKFVWSAQLFTVLAVIVVALFTIVRLSGFYN